MRPMQWICACPILFSLFAIGSTAGGATIGPGSGIVLASPLTHTLSVPSLDVHRIPVSLNAGTYSVSNFSFHNVTQGVTAGAIVPFLARLTNPGVEDIGPTRAYQTIWVGPSVAVNSVSDIDDPANVITVSYAGTQQFSLALGENLYAGFFTTGTARVAYRPALAEEFVVRSDHDASFGALTAAGQTATNFSNTLYNAVFGFHLSVEPSGTPPAVPGDFDGDTDVDGADFVAWQTNFPAESGKTLATGDADADGDVDGADFVVWQTNFPRSAAGGVAPVPEPPTALLLMASIVLAIVRNPFAIRQIAKPTTVSP